MKKIKYIGCLDLPNAVFKRFYVTSASNKMLYIIKALVDAGFYVEGISVSPSDEREWSFHRSECVKLSKDSELRFFPTVGTPIALVRTMVFFWHAVALFFYLIFHTKRNEPVIVYHSMIYKSAVLWAKAIVGFKMILEVEEIYKDVSNYGTYYSSLEDKMFRKANAYIFSTEFLDRKINTEKKPSVVIYGSYDVSEGEKLRFEDGKTHVVYAGTFDPRKGVLAAINSVRYLNKNYSIHICGFGTKEEIQQIQKEKEIIAKETDADIRYEGLLLGDDYLSLLKKCDIGLCTQDPQSAFTNTSFPSKVLSYLSNGLSVVSVKIPTIQESRISELVHFYDEQTPETIAECIMTTENKDYRREIEELGKQFTRDMATLINKEGER